MPGDGEHLSQEKFDDLTRELTERKTTLRGEILKRLAFAKSLGDLSENAEYHSAREDQGKNESRIRELEHLLKHAIIMTKPTGDTVAIGSTIVLARNDGSTATYTLVSAEEADMVSGKISYTSPLGKSLLGKKRGDDIIVPAPKGDVHYSITHLS